MLKTVVVAAALASLIAPTALAAQDEMIVVTGSRVDRDDYDEYYDSDQSAIGLTRKADNFVKPIFINSDSRDPAIRRAEVTAMLEATIRLAAQKNIALVAGDFKLVALTPETIEDLSYGNGSRPDTTRVKIYARLPVGGRFTRVDAVDETIADFVQTVPVTGRSYIETGGTDLAINNPQSYRGAVVKAIADEAKRYAAMFGSDYGIEIRGLDSELFFKQASETEVFLFIEHNFVIKPK
ncbi:MAG: hypothetical protein NWP98_04715 [Erythrobacter sp.]|nr:hypothetical protein [Erythrobacter sp.]